jgi:hypothetical protein
MKLKNAIIKTVKDSVKDIVENGSQQVKNGLFVFWEVIPFFMYLLFIYTFPDLWLNSFPLILLPFGFVIVIWMVWVFFWMDVRDNLSKGA